MNRKCPICQKEVKPSDSNHYFRCNNTIPKTEAKYEFISYNFPYISNKENLKLEYEDNLKSLPSLKMEFGIDFKSVIFLLDYHGIIKRSMSESSKLISVPKYKQTCNNKYGVDNVSKLNTIKIKKQQTFLKHYGVDNIWKSEEYYEWLHKHMLEKYGAKSVSNISGTANYWGWKTLTDEEKKDRLKKLLSNFSSKLELRVKKILEELNLVFEHQIFIKNYSFDFLIGDKLLLEVNGDYWHANPKFYSHDDEFFFRNGKTSKEIWDKDFKKIKLSSQYGYSVLTLWESDLNSMDDNEIKTTILNKIDLINSNKKL